MEEYKGSYAKQLDIPIENLPLRNAQPWSVSLLYVIYAAHEHYETLQAQGQQGPSNELPVRILQQLGFVAPDLQPGAEVCHIWEVSMHPIQSLLELPSKLSHAGQYEWVGIPNTCGPKWVWDSQEHLTVRADTIGDAGYIAVSYTWGRWKIGEKNCKGTPWPLPCIDATKCNLNLNYLKRILSEIPSCRYFWVDVLCIDQANRVEKSNEIAKQASIFAGAKAVINYMWSLDSGKELALALCDLGDLYLWCLRLSSSTHRQYSVLRNGDREEHLHEQSDKVRGDPWFSSLWTLQEMIVAPGSIWMARNGDYCKINEKIATTSLVASSILVLEAIVGTRNRLIAEYKNELIGRYGGELPSHVAEWFTINETDSISLRKMIKAWSEWATRDSSIVAAVLASRSMVLVAASRRQATRRRGIAILAALKVAYSVEFENDEPPEIGTLSLPIPLLNSVLHSDGTVILDAQHDCLPSGILPTTANRSLEEPSTRQEFLSFPTEQWHLEKDGVLHIPKGAIVQKMDETDSLDKISILANGAQSRERVTGPLRLISVVIEMAFGRGYRVMFVPLAMRLNPLPIKAEFGYAPMSNVRGVVIAVPRLALDENLFDIYWRKIGMYWSETGKFLGQLDAPEGIFVGNVDGKVTTQCGGTIERVLEAG